MCSHHITTAAKVQGNQGELHIISVYYRVVTKKTALPSRESLVDRGAVFNYLMVRSENKR